MKFPGIFRVVWLVGRRCALIGTMEVCIEVDNQLNTFGCYLPNNKRHRGGMLRVELGGERVITVEEQNHEPARGVYFAIRVHILVYMAGSVSEFFLCCKRWFDTMR